ncbi:hypothetical protein JMUB7510_30700 [Staphylococcus aureus]
MFSSICLASRLWLWFVPSMGIHNLLGIDVAFRFERSSYL